MTEMNGHVEFDQLLSLVDASAPSRATRSVRRHVAACWKCRSRLEELQDTVREFARYHEKVVLPNLPPPPSEWPDLHRRIQEADQNVQIFSLWTRVSAYLSLPARVPVKALILGVLVLACCVAAFTIASRKKDPGNPPVKPAVPAARETTPRAPEHVSRIALAPSTIVKLPSVDSEVQVFRALHEIEADLGDPVDVSTGAAGQIKVVGTGVSLARQMEIRDAVATVPNLVMEWHDSGARPEPGAHIAKSINLEAARNPFDEMLRPISGQSDWEAFANRMLNESDAILSRAHALKALDDHFSAARRLELAASDQSTLDQISTDLHAALADHVRNLDALLAPIFDALHASRSESGPVHSGVLGAAQRVDRLVSIIFEGATTTETPSQVVAELSQASADLKAAAGAKK